MNTYEHPSRTRFHYSSDLGGAVVVVAAVRGNDGESEVPFEALRDFVDHVAPAAREAGPARAEDAAALLEAHQRVRLLERAVRGLASTLDAALHLTRGIAICELINGTPDKAYDETVRYLDGIGQGAAQLISSALGDRA